MDAVVREWLVQVLGEEANTEWAKEVRRILVALFFVDDAFIASRNPAFLQRAMDVLVKLFDRVGLRTNVQKTKAVTFVPGKIRTRLSTEAYTRSQVGLQSRADWERRRVECDRCGVELSAASLRGHLETQHSVYQVQELMPEFLEDRPPVT